MLYYLLYHVLQKYFSPFNVFRYITVRTVYASLTAMFLALAFAAIGFVDDYAKVSKQQNLGLSSKRKFLLQIFVSSIVGIGLLTLATRSAYSTELMIPFLKRVHPDLVIHSLLHSAHFWPLAFVPFLIFVSVVAASSNNNVNLTDGLDGLAIGCTVIAAGALTVLTYVSSNYRWATYLEIQYIPRVGELTVL